ncbi:hypothetical protein [Halobacterium zhouii]|nr:hypothetical protein [Halobacterium zhouii]
MTRRLSESDWDRIQRFAKAPVYKRNPEMLLPEDEQEYTQTD